MAKPSKPTARKRALRSAWTWALIAAVLTLLALVPFKVAADLDYEYGGNAVIDSGWNTTHPNTEAHSGLLDVAVTIGMLVLPIVVGAGVGRRRYRTRLQ